MFTDFLFNAKPSLFCFHPTFPPAADSIIICPPLETFSLLHAWPSQQCSSLFPSLWFPLLVSVPLYKASPMAQWVKNPPAVLKSRETWVWSLGQEDPLKEGMATHSSIHSCLENPHGFSWAIARRVAKSWASQKWLTAHAYMHLYMTSKADFWGLRLWSLPLLHFSLSDLSSPGIKYYD